MVLGDGEGRFSNQDAVIHCIEVCQNAFEGLKIMKAEVYCFEGFVVIVDMFKGHGRLGSEFLFARAATLLSHTALT